MASDTHKDSGDGRKASGDAPVAQDKINPDLLPDTEDEPGDEPYVTTGATGEKPEGHDQLQDEELIEMLEQLSDTIDEANTMIAEQQAITSQMVSDGDPISPMPPPPPGYAQAARQRQTPVISVLAACVGGFLTIGALAAAWLFLSSQEATVMLAEGKDQSRIGKQAIASSSAVKQESFAGKEPQEEVKQAASSDTEPLPPKAANAEKETMPSGPEAEQKTVAGLSPEAQSEPDLAGQEPTGQETTASVPKFEPGEEALIMERGNKLLIAGDIAGARLAFEYGAQRGSMDAMYAMGRTYDPQLLKESGAVGIRPDIAAALQWYARAAELGHDAADARASELEKLAKN